MLGKYEEGVAKGKIEGENKKAIEIAHALIKQGVSLDIIVNAFGLSREELLKLASNQD